MRSHRLGRGATRQIHAHIDSIFDKAKGRFLGPHTLDKRIIFTYERTHSLPGVFEAGSREEGVRPDIDTLESLMRVAEQYIEATRERTKARVVNEINAYLGEARARGGVSQDELRAELGRQLNDVWDDVTANIHTIVDSETSTAKNTSVLDGIVGANAAAGISDPVVYFVVVRDNVLCKECKRLHLMDDEIAPRLWKLSAVGHGYHKKGDPNPKLGGLHPHCRCTLVTLMPGYGFNAQGMVTYIKPGHDEYAKQQAG